MGASDYPRRRLSRQIVGAHFGMFVAQTAIMLRERLSGSGNAISWQLALMNDDDYFVNQKSIAFRPPLRDHPPNRPWSPLSHLPLVKLTRAIRESVGADKLNSTFSAKLSSASLFRDDILILCKYMQAELRSEAGEFIV